MEGTPSGLALVVCVVAVVLVLGVVLRNLLRWRSRVRWHVEPSSRLVAIYHPFCASGGGGERVLWKLLDTLASLHSRGALRLHVVIFTADQGKSSQEILKSAQNRFGIDLVACGMPVDFIFIPMSLVRLVLPETWPRLTMVGQSLGSLLVAGYGLLSATPDIYMDTTGAAFTFPLSFFVFGARCVAYVHYPTVSVDMLRLVYERRTSYNHDSAVASSSLASAVKLLYYSVFALGYGLCGSCCSLTMVNSRWTEGHIRRLWRFGAVRPVVVYPPVGVQDFQGEKKGGLQQLGVHRIISIGQFRPEKDHPLQLRAFSLLTKQLARSSVRLELVLLGSCRSEDDERRVDELKRLAADLGISDSVVWVLNCSFEGLKGWLAKSTLGLHTMWNEHFGIGVVEMMAAGLVVVAHESGGPKVDIVCPTVDEDKENGVGFLADSAESFASAMRRALDLSSDHRTEVTSHARARSAMFSDAAFSSAIEAIVNDPERARGIF